MQRHVFCIAACFALASAHSLRRVVHNERAQRYSLDLSSLKLHLTKTEGSSTKVMAPMAGGVGQGMGFYMTNASVNGEEFACLNCDSKLFAEWLEQRYEVTTPASANITRTSDAAADSGAAGKHPNSPEYAKWAKENAKRQAAGSSSLLSIRKIPEVQVTYVNPGEVDAILPKLQTMWESRRMVVGNAANPLQQQMDFVDALSSLAQKSPALTGPDCSKEGIPYCDSLFSGVRTASGKELRKMLDDTFGATFLQQHKFDSKATAEDHRRHVQELLTALKSNFSFYYQKCLRHESGDETCSASAASTLVGQITCRPEDDKDTDDCVFAELRLCEKCQEAGPRFFEYARFHGPMALFETKINRHRVMGQCEEFSRAGHALLASLGYEARYVLDFTDHVWIEVFLNNTWVHADPSEGILDQPLMYEQGWGKHLTMIFAFTPTSIEHVTHRYTEDYDATISRRGITEESMVAVLKEANDRLQFELPRKEFGHQQSKAKNLQEVALWRHFEAN